MIEEKDRTLRRFCSGQGLFAVEKRWVMLAVLSFDICVGYLPYYTFVPIVHQGMLVYDTNEGSLNVLCILYAIAFVFGALYTGPIFGRLKCRGTFILATGLLLIGCVIRCGPDLMSFLLSMGVYTDPVTDPSQAHALFFWVVAGQALCASALPLLVNSTAELGAEWFSPHERPAAAMISNLMNFVGGSLSFVLPPRMVADDSLSVVHIYQSIQALLRVQLYFACGAFLLTLLVYRSSPAIRSEHPSRVSVSFFKEVQGVLCLGDFWIVSIQFSIYVSICQSFDAVEGSLLESAGYSAALTQWTGIACASASIFSTLVESRWVAGPHAYKFAIITANCMMALSMFLAALCIRFRLPECWFVVAIGCMGLATPGWGCSTELSSEICYPAHEATVTSLLEALGNLLSIICIGVAQKCIDLDHGPNVLLCMTFCSVLSACSLLFLSGQMPRSEAEAAFEASLLRVPCPQSSNLLEGAHACKGKAVVDCPNLSHNNVFGDLMVALTPVAPQRLCRPCVGGKLQAKRPLTGLAVICSLGICGLYWSRILLIREPSMHLTNLDRFVRVGSTLNASEVGMKLGMTEIPSSEWQTAMSRKRQPLHVADISFGPHHNPSEVSQERFPEPLNFVITCLKNSTYLKRFQRSMEANGLPFKTSYCTHGSVEEIRAAVAKGLLPSSAVKAAQNPLLAPNLGKALAHLRILKTIVIDNATLIANIFQDDEVVLPHFKVRREVLLQNIPGGRFDMINLNTLRPAGTRIKLGGSVAKVLQSKVYRLREGLRPSTNAWMGNYLVSSTGAAKILRVAQKYDGQKDTFSTYLTNQLYSSSAAFSFVGYSLETNKLSMHCERVGTWTKSSVCGE